MARASTSGCSGSAGGSPSATGDRTSPRRLAGVVTSFTTLPVSELPEMLEIYPDMAPDALIACIGVAVEECER